VGEYAVRRRGKSHWKSYLRTKALPQYPVVEQSVIEGWRKHVTKTMGLPPKKQADIYEWRCALLLYSLRRKPCDQHAGVLKRDANTLGHAAMRGDTKLFQAVGRLLGKKGGSDFLKQFDYPHAILSRWLTDFYWLMPAKLVSRRLSLGLGVKDNLKSFLAAKSRYGLKSHQPNLIEYYAPVTPDVEKHLLTKRGKLLLGG